MAPNQNLKAKSDTAQLFTTICGDMSIYRYVEANIVYSDGKLKESTKGNFCPRSLKSGVISVGCIELGVY